jgi:beta-lactamase class C
MKIVFIILVVFQACIASLYAKTGSDVTLQTEVVDTVIKPFMKENDVPGIAIGLYYKGDESVICYGLADKAKNVPVTQDTIFEIASITKVFTSTELALQVNRGYMSLSNPLSNYLPGITRYKGDINQVTLENLATHTSSLPRELPHLKKGKAYDHTMVINFLQNWEPDYPIGTKYVYSNLGFGLLGYAIEDVEHMPYEQFIKNDLLTPLDMNSTMVDVPAYLLNNYAQGYSPQGNPVPRWPHTILPGGGALRSTASDMLKFLEANLGVKGSKEVLDAMQLAHQGFFKVNDKLTIGLGWQRVKVREMLIIDKNGGLPGFASYIGMIPEKKIGIVILANKSKIKSTLVGRQLLMRLAKQS